MIHKVSGSNAKMDLFSETTHHESLNKSAMTSFESVMLAAASKLIKEGNSVADVASKFGMSEVELKTVIANAKQSEAVVPVEKSASVDQPKSDDAQEAYNELHGITPREESNFQPRNGSTIHSAMGNQSVSDIGGPKGQIRYQNSIWDSEVLKRQAENKSGDEIIKESRAAEQARRDALRKQNHTIDEGAIKHAMEMGQAKGVSNMSGNDGYKFSQKLPKRGISIFDSGEFERIPEKTEGEKAVEKVAKTAQREFTSDITSSKRSSQSIFDSMIESMLTEPEAKKKKE